MLLQQGSDGHLWFLSSEWLTEAQSEFNCNVRRCQLCELRFLACSCSGLDRQSSNPIMFAGYCRTVRQLSCSSGVGSATAEKHSMHESGFDKLLGLIP